MAVQARQALATMNLQARKGCRLAGQVAPPAIGPRNIYLCDTSTAKRLKEGSGGRVMLE